MRLWYGLLMVGFVGIVVFLAFAYTGKLSGNCPFRVQTSQAVINKYYSGSGVPQQQCVALEIADSPKEREHGLSDRRSLADTAGLLFVFDRAGKQCFWMKDMRFSIDMIWLDGDKKILKIERGVSPATYPQTFCPPQPAQYVIEVNDGVADRAGLAVGQRLKL